MCVYACVSEGMFAGQQGYGYRSLEQFVDAATALTTATTTTTAATTAAATVTTAITAAATAAHVSSSGVVAAVGSASVLAVTAVLEAGKRSLQAGGMPIRILYNDECSGNNNDPQSSAAVGVAGDGVVAADGDAAATAPTATVAGVGVVVAHEPVKLVHMFSLS